jgi:TPR repeat protein
MNGKGVERNTSKGIQLAKKSVEIGNSQAKCYENEKKVNQRRPNYFKIQLNEEIQKLCDIYLTVMRM